MAEEIAIGQVYYCTASTDPESDLPDGPSVIYTIGRIDRFDNADRSDMIVSVSAIPNPDTASEDWPPVNHMPFVAEAIAGPDCRLTDSDSAVPDGFEDGYQTWREAWDANEAGAFTLSPAQAYAAIIHAMKEGASQ